MIYIIESGEYFKVGYSGNVTKRLKGYLTHNPSFNLVRTFEGDIILEQHIQNNLSIHNYKNEWFNKFDGYVEVIEEMCKSYKPPVIDENFVIRTSPSYQLLAKTIKDKLDEDDFQKLIECGFILRLEGEYYANTQHVLDVKDMSKRVLDRMMKKGLMIIVSCYRGNICSLNKHYPKFW